MNDPTVAVIVGIAIVVGSSALLKGLPWAIRKAFQDIVKQALADALLDMQKTTLGPLLLRLHALEEHVYSNGDSAHQQEKHP